MKLTSRSASRFAILLSALLLAMTSCSAPKKYGCPNHLQASLTSFIAR